MLFKITFLSCCCQKTVGAQKNIIEQLFALAQQKKVHTIFIAFLIVITTYSIGKITALFLKGDLTNGPKISSSIAMPNLKHGPNDLTIINTANIFNAKKSHGEVHKKEFTPQKIDSRKICLKAQKKSTLSIKLINTTVLQIYWI